MLRIGQVEATATQDGKYTDGSVAGGIAATRLRAAAFNAMQEELAHIVESAGLALDINDMTQVLKAIQKLTLSRANPFADIESDGAAAISTALTNLGLGEAAKRDVGTGDNQIPDMNDFTSSLTSPGWQKLPSGLIIQWGTANPSSTGEIFITFPVAFSAYPMYVGFGPQQASLPNVVQSPVISAPTITNLGCGVRNLMIPTAGGAPVASMSSFFWIAVGK
ncbi:gp53-like domain-containing protein [Escherichia coli]|uniref:gp53-like domain-containing protein n=1 Tax=Escherichia coli TaxID=562 RepID=UPI003C77F6B5